MLTKYEFREMNKKRRLEMTAFEVTEKSKKITEYFLKSEIYKNSKTIMLYMPLKNEVDTTDIIKKAAK